MSNDDILIWADGTWCHRDEVHEMNHMSDDYEVLTVGTEKWSRFIHAYEQSLVSD